MLNRFSIRPMNRCLFCKRGAQCLCLHIDTLIYRYLIFFFFGIGWSSCRSEIVDTWATTRVGRCKTAHYYVVYRNLISVESVFVFLIIIALTCFQMVTFFFVVIHRGLLWYYTPNERNTKFQRHVRRLSLQRNLKILLLNYEICFWWTFFPPLSKINSEIDLLGNYFQRKQRDGYAYIWK